MSSSLRLNRPSVATSSRPAAPQNPGASSPRATQRLPAKAVSADGFDVDARMARARTFATTQAMPRQAKATASTAIVPLKSTDKGTDVRHAQMALIRLGCLPPDQIVRTRGDYNASTKLAVRRFQEKNHLPVTGEIDATTAKVMNEQLAKMPPGPKTKGDEVRTFIQFYQDHPEFDRFKDKCLSMVQLAYEFAGVPLDQLSKPADARASYDAFAAAGLVKPYDPKNPPPPGAIVFWDRTGPNKNNGHIVVSTGDGNVISTGWGKQGVAQWPIGDKGDPKSLSGQEKTDPLGWVAPPPEFNDPVE